MAPETMPDKLIGAAYLFFLKNETDPMPGLNRYISESHKPQVAKGGFQLGLDSEVPTDTFITKEGPPHRLDLQKQVLASVLSVSIAVFIGSNETPDWAAQIEFLDKCRRAVEADGVDVLGTTVVAVGDPNIEAESFDKFKEGVGERLKHVSAALRDNKIHQLLGDLNHQFFFIENFANEDLEGVLEEELPRVVWAMQRLTREMAFFQDRLQTIMSEKRQIDSDLSQVFHREVGLAPDEDSANTLEELITRLSSMYSVMATDLHLVSDAVNTFDTDLNVLEERATDFGADDDEAFPRYRLATFYTHLKELKKREAALRLSLNNTKAAIDIAQTQAEILRGKQGLILQEQTRELLDQNVTLQDERASLQAAASVVELVVIFYYSLVSWKTIAPHDTVEALPSLIKFGVIGLFSFSVVLLTHYVGASLHNKKVKWVPILISGGLVLASLVAMALLPQPIHE